MLFKPVCCMNEHLWCLARQKGYFIIFNLVCCMDERLGVWSGRKTILCMLVTGVGVY